MTHERRTAMKNIDDKLREELGQAEIPAELEPENIEKMLAEKAPAKKRTGIKMIGRIAAGAAACAMIGGSAAYLYSKDDIPERKNGAKSDAAVSAFDESQNAIDIAPEAADDGEIVTLSAPYMEGAQSYRQVYRMFGKAANNARKEYSYTSGVQFNGMDMAVAEEAEDGEGYNDEKVADTPKTSGSDDSTGSSHSDTFNQEDGVLEADKVKTDGRYIYYLGDYSGYINIAEADNGRFIRSSTLDIEDSIDFPTLNGSDDYAYVEVRDMYLYNDMLAVIGTYSCYPQDYNYSDSIIRTFAAFYTTGTDPELIDVYYQSGSYSDVRISPDGYLYLLSTYWTASFDNIRSPKDTDKYIPYCGLEADYCEISPECILLPEEGFGDSYSLTYTVIGSVDLNESGRPVPTDSKALAGYSGNMYCSADNMYTIVYDGDDTDVTRIAISAGTITPAASGTVAGYVNDQFSMSEYNGFFRIATTVSEYEEVFHKYSDEDWYDYKEYGYNEDDGWYSYELTKRDNRVYVLDLDMNEVGMIGDFGLDESVKSVNFSGDLAYVVTFRQTDPLFAIDLSDPANPAILSELHMNGFSTYMQRWSDDLLLGFGVDADDDGRQTGIKLAMYDNSDPNDLREAAVYTINYTDDGANYSWVSSPATWDRKALLIAPEKDLIAVPVTIEGYTENGDEYNWETTDQLMIFSYADGEFTLRGTFCGSRSVGNYYYTNIDRSVYIGDYIYALSADEFIAASLDDITVTDTVEFEAEDNDYYWYGIYED